MRQARTTITVDGQTDQRSTQEADAANLPWGESEC